MIAGVGDVERARAVDGDIRRGAKAGGAARPVRRSRQAGLARPGGDDQRGRHGQDRGRRGDASLRVGDHATKGVAVHGGRGASDDQRARGRTRPAGVVGQGCPGGPTGGQPLPLVSGPGGVRHAHGEDRVLAGSGGPVGRLGGYDRRLRARVGGANEHGMEIAGCDVEGVRGDGHGRAAVAGRAVA